MTRPLNLGLIDAISRIGGFERAELPALLDGIQPVLIYGDVSRGVATDIFEARGIAGDNLSGWIGIELAIASPGGAVIEEATLLVITNGSIPLACVNIATAPASVLGLGKMDVGGVATVSQPSRIVPPLAFAAQVPVQADLAPPGFTMWTARATSRFFVPAGSFFQWFPTVLPPPNFVSVSLVWRELADIQGPQ